MEPHDRHARWGRVSLLCSANRHDLAVAELRRFVADFPDFAPAHARLATILSLRDEHAEAADAARRAVTLAPLDGYAHYALAFASHARDAERQALRSIREALRLDPDDADYLALQAEILLSAGRWKAGLASADAALAVRPEHVVALNLRAQALAVLGRRGAAGLVVDASLRLDPENAWTHEVRGYERLRQRDVRGAAADFLEALRLDPGRTSAREGLAEAMKARSRLYWFLHHRVTWRDRLFGPSPGWARGLLIAVLVVAQAPMVLAGFMAMLAARLSTRCTGDLLLLLHPQGRHALSDKARGQALLFLLTILTVVGATLLMAGFVWAGAAVMFAVALPLPVVAWRRAVAGRKVRPSFLASLLPAAVCTWWLVRCMQLAGHRAMPGAAVDPAMVHRVHVGFLIFVTMLFVWLFVLRGRKLERR